VAETFLRRWFGKKPADPGAEEARAEIDRVLADRPELRGPLSWLREILDDLVPVPGLASVPLPEPDAARAKLLAGVPLLRGEPVTFAEAELVRRWERFRRALPPAAPAPFAPGADPVVVGGRTDPFALMRAIRGDGLPPGRGMVHTLTRFVHFPALVPIADATAPLRRGVPWDRGYCPVCGGPPLLAEFRGLDQSRFLRCGDCAASWEAPRQWCPACGNRDHELLGFLSREGEEARYRVATCDACRTGIKTLSTLSALPPLMLLVADAATLHLDLAAADRGYQPPSAAAVPGGVRKEER
jgi:RNA polymerase subunit RPABC4/transcription elongation factor Spt4